MLPDPSKKPTAHAHGYKPGDLVHVPAKVVRVNDDGEQLLLQAETGQGVAASPMFHVPASIAVALAEPAGAPAEPPIAAEAATDAPSD